MNRKKTNQDVPKKLTTARHNKNLFVVSAILSVLIAWIAIHAIVKASSGFEQASSISSDASNGVAESNEVVSSDQNNVNDAKSFLDSYYKALSSYDASALREIGAIDAANSVSNGWLQNMGYKANYSAIGLPDATVMPQPVSTYAGYDLYNVSDFYHQSASSQSENSSLSQSLSALSSDNSNNAPITSIVTGNTSIGGWMYYNAETDKWVIIDPTIPTFVSSPEATNVERTSSDRQANVRMSTPGAYSNPWWSYAQVSIAITNTSTQDIAVDNADLDDGITVINQDDILGAVPAGESKQSISTVYRGEINNFTLSRIGAQPLSINGNICPIKVSYGDEDISPVIAIGTDSDSTKISSLLSDEQKKKYEAH